MNLMFPKSGSTRKNKKRRHPQSIMHKKDGTCYLCMMKGNDRTYTVVHEHHVYDGPNRRVSEENGFKCWLCLEHHITGPEAVHNNIYITCGSYNGSAKGYTRRRTQGSSLWI